MPKVAAGSVAAKWAQSAGGGNPMQGPGAVARLIAHINEAMAGDDIQSALTLQSSLLVFTDGAPGEPDARAQGYGPGAVDKVYTAVSIWVNAQGSQAFNEAVGPGASQSSGIAAAPISPEEALARAGAAQLAATQQQASNSNLFRQKIREGLQARGVDFATIEAEIARLNAIFGDAWPFDDWGVAWQQVSPSLRALPVKGTVLPLVPPVSTTPNEWNEQNSLDDRFSTGGKGAPNRPIGPGSGGAIGGAGAGEIAAENNTVTVPSGLPFGISPATGLVIAVIVVVLLGAWASRKRGR